VVIRRVKKKFNNQESNITAQSLGKIIHPKLIEINYDADKYDFEWTFGGRNLKFPIILLSISKRVFNFFRKNPIYKFKFGLTPFKQIGLIKAIPHLRDFFTTCVYYLIEQKDIKH
jgi:hypothetical protein